MRRLLATMLLVCLSGAPVLAGPAQACAAMHADAKKLLQDEAYDTRYLYDPAAEKGDAAALAYQVNNLNGVRATPAKLRPVAAGLWAVRLSEWQPDATVWERQHVEPYFHRVEREKHGGYWYRVRYFRDYPGLRESAKLLYSRVPIVRADWWFVQSSRQVDLFDNDKTGFGYYDWLRIKSQADFEKLIALDRKTAIRLDKELRAAVEAGRSGVVQLDRQVEWFAAYDGDAWVTLDTFSNANGNTAPANLERGQFKHQAVEGYGSLPWGGWVYLLADDKGGLQNSAPDKLGGSRHENHRGNDLRIHVLLDCSGCHAKESGLRSIDDWARRTLKLPSKLTHDDYYKLDQLKRQYFGDINARLERGRDRFEKAVKLACGLTVAEAAKAHSAYYYRYVMEPWTAERLAVSLGTTEERLLRALKLYFEVGNKSVPNAERRRLADLEGLLAEDAAGLHVTVAEQLFGDLDRIVRLYP